MRGGETANPEMTALVVVGDALAADDSNTRADGHHNVCVVHGEEVLPNTREGHERLVAKLVHPLLRGSTVCALG
jgi:hypothetical protein